MGELLANYGTFVYLGIFVVFFYLFLIRPQQKQQKARTEMISNLKAGDKVINHGGIIGTISEIKEDNIVVKIADKIEISMLREGIARVLSK